MFKPAICEQKGYGSQEIRCFFPVEDLTGFQNLSGLD
jgi:hypothetical protein